jgi:phosphoadenosine phosphosulfate reductase
MALLEVFARPFDPLSAAAAHAELLNERFARWRTRDLLEEVITHEFPGRIALVSSFGAESVVLLHLVAAVDPTTPVIFIDTGKIFGATHRYREELVARLGLKRVEIARPDPAVLTTQDIDAGLWLKNPEKCCAIRKVAPLSRALAHYDAWISGRKRFQASSRADMPLVEADGTRIKVNPLAAWRREDLSAYRGAHDLPEHPLVAHGFRSIGCIPCTTRVAEDEDERDGRWRGREKTECGIHLGLAAFEADGSGI